MGADDIRNDPMLMALKVLATPDVDGARAARIRDRYRRALRRRQWVDRVTSISAIAVSQRILEFALIATLCGVYLAEVLRRALSLLG